MKQIAIFFLIVICSFSATSQINFKKLREKATSKINAKALLIKEKKLKKLREEQLVKDTLFYNYIFSQGNRASFFANRESKENTFLTLGKKYEDETIKKEDLEVYEQVFDLNHSAEFSIYVNPKIAALSFLEALELITQNKKFERLSFNEAFSIKEMVDVDTMSLPEKYALGKTIANISIMIHTEGKHNLSESFVNETIDYFQEVIGKESIALAS